MKEKRESVNNLVTAVKKSLSDSLRWSTAEPDFREETKHLVSQVAKELGIELSSEQASQVAELIGENQLIDWYPSSGGSWAYECPVIGAISLEAVKQRVPTTKGRLEIILKHFEREVLDCYDWTDLSAVEVYYDGGEDIAVVYGSSTEYAEVDIPRVKALLEPQPKN